MTEAIAPIEDTIVVCAMKVYVVTVWDGHCTDHDGIAIVGIFSTLEKAKEFLAGCDKTEDESSAEIFAWPVDRRVGEKLDYDVAYKKFEIEREENLVYASWENESSLDTPTPPAVEYSQR